MDEDYTATMTDLDWDTMMADDSPATEQSFFRSTGPVA